LTKCHSSTKTKTDGNYFSRRSALDILSIILTEAKQAKTKTHIMYKCNLSYTQLKNYIQLLQEMELLNKQQNTNKKTKKLKSTSKGIKFLQTYAELKAILNLDFRE